MKWDITRGIAQTGVVLTICMTAMITSFIVYERLYITHPLAGGFIASALFLGSPLILAFQLLAIFMTKQSDITGAARIVAFSINIVGSVIGTLLIVLLVFLWRMGPINPG
jgi:hypothetical protein